MRTSIRNVQHYAAALLTVACSGDVGDSEKDAQPAGSGAQTSDTANSGSNDDGTSSSAGSNPSSGSMQSSGSAGSTGSASSNSGMGDDSNANVDDEGTGSNPTEGSDSSPQTNSGRELCDSSAVLDVGLSKLRRLTRTQLNNTLRDLVGAQGEPAAMLVPDERIGPFDSNSIAPVDDLIVVQHQELAAKVAAEAMPRSAEIAGCDLATEGCADQFIDGFGLRAFRRPLEADEKSGLMDLYELGAESGGVEQGFRLVLEAVLQSPSFIYLADVGETGLATGSPTLVDAYSLASRLSYFLWNTLPDDELFQRAEDGSLTSEAELATQVDRMLLDPRAADTIALFHTQLLRLDHLHELEKDPQVFPEFSPELAEAMLQETADFTSSVILEGDGQLGTLLTASYSYPRGALFEIYGTTPPPGFAPGDRVELAATERSGLLTQAAFLTSHAKRNATSPVHRGIIVRENLLCQIIPPPPDDVVTVLPPASEATTTRERFAQHLADPTCAACHALIDPIGLSFENYDGVGKFRTTEGTQAVDASGAIVGGGADLEADYQNAVEMSKLLGNADIVQDCMATQWFRFALGRTDSDADACSMAAVRNAFAATDGNIPALLAGIASSDAFRHVRSTATSSEVTP